MVEDDDHVRAYVVGLLTRLGYKVLTATNGEQALRLMEAGAKADILFTDIVMPGISSFELARTRESRASWFARPVYLGLSAGFS